MASLSAIETARELISYAIVTDKDGVVKLLKRNGIELPNNPSDNEVTIALLMANEKSGVFRNELKNYLSSLTPSLIEHSSFLGGDKSFTGIDDFSFTSEDYGYKNAGGADNLLLKPKYTAPSVTTGDLSNKAGGSKVGSTLGSIGSWFKDNILTKENINAGIQLGLASMANKTAQKQNQLQAESLQLQQYQDTLRQQLPAGAKKSNTMTYVWIGVGVLVVGVLGVVLYKQYKK